MTSAATAEVAAATLADVPARLAFADLAALLAPVTGDAPAGSSLRYDAVYDRIRESRREDNASLPQGVWQHDLKRADWAEVARLASNATVMRGKDLQVAAWLLEAWIHLYGFAGTRQGFELLFGLCEKFWADLHPLPDGDDFGARGATIDWVNQRLDHTIEAIPLTAPKDAGIRAWTWADHEAVLKLENDLRRAEKGGPKSAPAEVDPGFTSAAFGASAEMTPRSFYADAVEDLSASIAAARALGMLLDESCGVEAPSLRQVIDSMTSIRDWMKPMSVSPHAGVAQGVPALDEAPLPSDGQQSEAGAADDLMNGERMDPSPDAAPVSPSDHARARADAYRKLAEAAQTLMRIEPHSPTPYLVRRAIAWGGMSLAELMRLFIDSGYDLRSLYSMLGMDDGEAR